MDGGADVPQGIIGQGGHVGLGPRVEHGSRSQIVCPGGLGPQGLLRGVGGHAQNLTGSQLLPDQSGLHVLLPHMDPVGPDLQGQVHVVVDEEGCPIPAAQGLDLQGLPAEMGEVQLLLPQLDHSGPAQQGLLHLLSQGLAL